MPITHCLIQNSVQSAAVHTQLAITNAHWISSIQHISIMQNNCMPCSIIHQSFDFKRPFLNKKQLNSPASPTMRLAVPNQNINSKVRKKKNIFAFNFIVHRYCNCECLCLGTHNGHYGSQIFRMNSTVSAYVLEKRSGHQWRCGFVMVLCLYNTYTIADETQFIALNGSHFNIGRRVGRFCCSMRWKRPVCIT